ncbi:MAG TPA: alpha-ketoacid dehydrogenase subunit beta, partial [Exiguobacterium sp.]|nr:alpha-ketoacid dehydrogenase subunit beta [Exiguobacterium sp.]
LYLRAPIARVTGFDVPVPLFALEDHYIPTPERVLATIQRTVEF